jgi:hypothetical protein
MTEPESVAQLIAYVEEHKGHLGFPPASVFLNDELQADIEKFISGFPLIEDSTFKFSVNTIMGVRLLRHEPPIPREYSWEEISGEDC